MITSANTIFALAVTNLFNAPVLLQQFAADDIFTTDDVELNQVSMGVDGIQTGGKVLHATVQTVALQADSISVEIFDQWIRQENAVKETYVAQGTVQFPSLGTKWSCVNGILIRGRKLPDAGTVLQSRRFTISWEDVRPANF